MTFALLKTEKSQSLSSQSFKTHEKTDLKLALEKMIVNYILLATSIPFFLVIFLLFFTNLLKFFSKTFSFTF